MPETPNFDRLAQQMADRLYETIDGVTKPIEDGPTIIMTRAWYVEQLRQVWNARGAADVTKLEAELSLLMGSTKAGPYVKNLDRALRTLDR